MKKSYRILSLLLLFVIVFAACSAGTTKRELAICASYAVPGMFTEELKGNHYSCDILEEDTEGRVLFEFTAKCVISGKEETAVVVCQSHDDDYVYYIEDLCYLMNNPSPSEIDRLKEANDWDKPLDFGKMSRRENLVSFDLYIITNTELSYKRIRNIVCAEMGIESTQLRELCFMDYDGEDCAMYYLSFENQGSLHQYLVIVNSSYEVSFLQIKDSDIDPIQISEFKQNSDWHHGFNSE